jgi:hypothetical protein
MNEYHELLFGNSIQVFCNLQSPCVNTGVNVGLTQDLVWEYWNGAAWESCTLYQPYWSGSTEDHSNLELMVPKKHRTWRYLRPILT